MKPYRSMVHLVLALAASLVARAIEPTVTHLRVLPRAGTKLVDIVYDLTDIDSGALQVALRVSADGGKSWTSPAAPCTGSGIGQNVAPGVDRQVLWDAGADGIEQWSDQVQVQVLASELPVPVELSYLEVDLSAGPSASRYPVRYIQGVSTPISMQFRGDRLLLRRVPAGTFVMGSPAGEIGRFDGHENPHEVTITQPFFVGVFEVTQRQWELVMGTNPSQHLGEARPVESVSWVDARGGKWPGGTPAGNSFLARLRQRTGEAFDLPTEAQWEYACRAGTVAALSNGWDLVDEGADAKLGEIGRYCFGVLDGKGGGFEQHTIVGCYQPNPWGLYDLHGNVWEWCLDWWVDEDFAIGPFTDPVGPTAGTGRVPRGGSWNYGARFCRAAARTGYWEGNRSDFVGLRVVRNASRR